MDDRDHTRGHAGHVHTATPNHSAPWCEECNALLTHEHERLLRQDEAMRGVGHAQEMAFRSALREWTFAYALTLPLWLYGEIMDHLTRTDAQGYSLCFNSPLRDTILDHLFAWLEAHHPEDLGVCKQSLYRSHPSEASPQGDMAP